MVTDFLIAILFSQIQHTEEEKKRKGVDDKNPTLYWEYKWTEDADAEVLIIIMINFSPFIYMYILLIVVDIFLMTLVRRIC